MTGVRLTILPLSLPAQRYSCHGCGNCCRDFTVQLREDDLRKIAEQRWDERLGEPVTIEFRGVTYLRQRPGGACVFLQDDGRCRIHAEFGFHAKPIACQLFPFHLTPSPGTPAPGMAGPSGVIMGLSFACPSVMESKGAALRTHVDELGRMLRELPEFQAPAPMPLLNDRLRASREELEAVTSRLDRWLARIDLGFCTRLDGLAWIVSSLAAAKLEGVRDRRFADLLDVLLGALPQELDHHPISAPTSRQMKMLRRAAFARTEDPRMDRLKAQGRARIVISQLLRQRRFASGRGTAPRIGADWPDHVPLESIDGVKPARSPDQVKAIDELMTRYLRACLLGGRCWGAGYYGWPIVRGLEALLLNMAVLGWLARLHAAGRNHDEIDLIDVHAALGRVERTAGRAKWLGSPGERLRLRYLELDAGLRRLLRAYAQIASDV